jgi:hypothetical protein
MLTLNSNTAEWAFIKSDIGGVIIIIIIIIALFELYLQYNNKRRFTCKPTRVSENILSVAVRSIIGK